MKSITKIYLLITILLWPVLLISKYYDIVFWQKLSVPLFVTLVFLYSWYLNPLRVKINLFLFLAFLFVCAGDYILNLTPFGKWFVIPFVLVHLNLIVYFSSRHPWQRTDFKYLVPILTISLVIYLIMWNKIASTAQLVLFAAYLLLLSTMVWRAICSVISNSTKFRIVMVAGGAILFYITDVSVATNEVLKTNFLVALTWLCYPPALVMLSLMNYPVKEKAI